MEKKPAMDNVIRMEPEGLKLTLPICLSHDRRLTWREIGLALYLRSQPGGFENAVETLCKEDEGLRYEVQALQKKLIEYKHLNLKEDRRLSASVEFGIEDYGPEHFTEEYYKAQQAEQRSRFTVEDCIGWPTTNDISRKAGQTEQEGQKDQISRLFHPSRVYEATVEDQAEWLLDVGDMLDPYEFERCIECINENSGCPAVNLTPDEMNFYRCRASYEELKAMLHDRLDAFGYVLKGI